MPELGYIKGSRARRNLSGGKANGAQVWSKEEQVRQETVEYSALQAAEKPGFYPKMGQGL